MAGDILGTVWKCIRERLRQRPRKRQSEIMNSSKTAGILKKILLNPLTLLNGCVNLLAT